MTQRDRQKEALNTFRAIRSKYDESFSNDYIMDMAIAMVKRVEYEFAEETPEEESQPKAPKQPTRSQVLAVVDHCTGVWHYIKNRDMAKYPDGLPLSVLRSKTSKEEVQHAIEIGMIQVVPGKRWIYELVGD